MTKEAALHAFFNSFGIPGFPASAVPEDRVFPWLTYELATGAFEEGETPITVNLWYYTTDESVPNAKAREISEFIGLGGYKMRCDGGGLWIKRGHPFSQAVQENNDTKVKRRYIQISVEFITPN